MPPRYIVTASGGGGDVLTWEL